MGTRLSRGLLLGLILIVIWSRPAASQGTIRGKVIDSSGTSLNHPNLSLRRIKGASLNDYAQFTYDDQGGFEVTVSPDVREPVNLHILPPTERRLDFDKVIVPYLSPTAEHQIVIIMLRFPEITATFGNAGYSMVAHRLRGDPALMTIVQEPDGPFSNWVDGAMQWLSEGAREAERDQDAADFDFPGYRTLAAQYGRLRREATAKGLTGADNLVTIEYARSAERPGETGLAPERLWKIFANGTISSYAIRDSDVDLDFTMTGLPRRTDQIMAMLRGDCASAEILGDRVAVPEGEGLTVLRDLNHPTLPPRRRVPLDHNESVLAESQDHRYLIIIDRDRGGADLISYDGEIEADRRRLDTGEAAVLSAAFSPDGKWLATGSSTGRVQLWDVTLGEAVLDHQLQENFASMIDFSDDGQTVVVGSGVGRSGSVAVFERRDDNWRFVAEYATEAPVVRAVLSADGKTIGTTLWGKWEPRFLVLKPDGTIVERAQATEPGVPIFIRGTDPAVITDEAGMPGIQTINP